MGAGPTNSCCITGAAQRLSSSRLRLATGGFTNTYLVIASPMTNAPIKPIRCTGWSGVAVTSFGATCSANTRRHASAAIGLVIAVLICTTGSAENRTRPTALPDR